MLEPSTDLEMKVRVESNTCELRAIGGCILVKQCACAPLVHLCMFRGIGIPFLFHSPCYVVYSLP
jgi:hypothetical protein